MDVRVQFGGSPGTGNASPTTSQPAPATANYGSIFGYSADDGAREIQYYEKQDLSHFMGPVANRQVVQKKGTYAQVFGNFGVMRATDPAGFKALQQNLFTAGFYAPYLKKGETVRPGEMDSATVSALNDAMGEAVLEGHPVEDVLKERTAAGGDTGAGGGSVTQVHKTNPDQLKAAIQSVAPSLLGKRAPDDVVNQIVGKYQDLEGKQNAQIQGGDATVTDAPTGSDWFQEQLQQLMPNTTKSYQIFQGLAAAQSNIGQPVTQLYHG